MISLVRLYSVYLLLALLILGPLLGSGYILTLDMVPAPPEPDWLQKLVLLGAFFGAGVGAHRLVAHLLRGAVYNTRIAHYFAGLLYVVNPFVYSRFMAGQYLVLLGYAMFPFFVRAWLRFLDAPSPRRALVVTFWFVGIGYVSLHTIGLALIVAILCAVFYMRRLRRDRPRRKRAFRLTFVIIGLSLIMHGYWLVPALLGQGRTVSVVAGFGAADLAAFATHSDGLGWLGNVLALQGFWADTKSLYVVPMDMYSWWWLPWIALWPLIGFGVYKSWKTTRGVTLAFGMLILVGAILAIGTAGTLAAPINEFLIRYVPFFAGYREPQKFVALIALAYAYFGAVGIAALVDLVRIWRKNRELIPLLPLPLFILPVLIAPLLLWGGHGQLRPRQYPADWYAANEYLRHNDPTAKVLFLPWHLYMRFDFAGRVIANPADKFFANPVIASGDPEMDGAKSYTSSFDQRELQSRILPSAVHGSDDFAKNLHMLNIRYVILAKDLDYKRYGFLGTQPGFSLVQETATVTVYKVNQSE